MKTLEDLLIEREEDASGFQPCPQCEAETALFSLVIISENPDEIMCGRCYLESIAEPASEIVDAWESELGKSLKGQRNHQLDRLRWTVAVDSPLHPDCQALWLAYLNSIHRMTIDCADPENWVWEAEPPFFY